MTDTTAAKSHSALLQAALAHVNRNEIGPAEALLAQVLTAEPEEPNALQLLGLIRKTQNYPADAESLYRRSLAADPSQAHVHHNLGNLLHQLGRIDEAIACEREAVRLKPNYIDGLLGLGAALSSKDDFAGAEKAYRDALRIQPNHMPARQSLSVALNGQEKYGEAEAVIHQALAAGSRNPRQIAALQYNLGIALKGQRRYVEALKLFDTAQAAVPEMPGADYSRANTLQMLGQFDEALICYRRALAHNPLDLPAHRDLNHLLYRMGRDAEFLRSYDDAMGIYPDLGKLALAKANFQFQAGDFEKARENYARAASVLGNNVMPHDGLALCAARLGEFETAIREHELVLRLEPQNGHGWRNYAETLLRAGDASKALTAAERSIAIEPFDQAALGIWGLALRALDDPREEGLNDYENLVQEFEIEPPAGYADMTAFNRDLNAYLDRLHRDKREFVDQTLRGGTQTINNLFGAGHDLVERLRQRIDNAVATYVARMKEDAGHPLFKRRRAQFGYAGSWSSRLKDCGFHTNHVHPKGWISSAYYIALPEAVDDVQGRQGWIKFGEPAFEAGFKNPVRRNVKPKPGTLVLFPSYMWHGTVPFRSEEARTTIAFDVVPL